MSPYEIIVIPNPSSGDEGGQQPLRPRPRFLRLKMALVAFLVGSVVIGLLVAAFMIGTVIAIVALGFVAITAAVLFIRRLFGVGGPRRYT